MTADFTRAKFDFDNIRGLVSPGKKLSLEGPAIGFIRLSPEEGYTFTHEHRKQEEVYIVIEGSGCILLDGVTHDIKRGDAVRVSAKVRRALKGGSNGIFVICAGGIPMGYPENKNARYLIDDGIPHYDDIPPWYEGNEEVIKKNALLKMRMMKNSSPEKCNE